MSLLETAHELAVRYAVKLGRRADARDPQPAKGPFLDPTVPVSERKGALDGLARGPVESAAAPDVPLGEFHDLLASFFRFSSTLGSWHVWNSFLIVVLSN